MKQNKTCQSALWTRKKKKSELKIKQGLIAKSECNAIK